jgi:hypothetical protein
MKNTESKAFAIPAGLTVEEWVNYNELLIVRAQRGSLGRLNSEFIKEIEGRIGAGLKTQ